jgi:hypothetical protein
MIEAQRSPFTVVHPGSNIERAAQVPCPPLCVVEY